MAHNTRTHPDATWTNGGAEGYTTTPADLEDLERKAFQGINGDRGGTYAPATPVVIGDGSSPGAATPSMTVTGPTLVAYGGSVATASQARFHLPDYPAFGPVHTSRSRKILTSCIQRQATQPFHWITVPGGVRSIACTIQDIFGGNALEQPSFVLPLRVHDGATLARATLTFRVASPRTLAPFTMPKVRIVRVDASGNYLPLKATADGTGYVSPPSVSSGAGWYNGGNAQTLVYECDQNNVIDSGQYMYKAQVIEEAGTDVAINPAQCDGVRVRGRLGNVMVATNPVTDFGTITFGEPVVGSPEIPASLDGITLADGMRFLVWTQQLNGIGAAAAGNGVWGVVTIGSGPGAFLKARRVIELSDPSHFTPGLLVGVEVGARFGQSMWELVSPVTRDRPTILGGTNDDGTLFSINCTPIKFQRRQPTGNIYHSFVCEFTSIPDMRFP